jgi:D-alanyl-D-alanine carboxypeptidase/D-alanyl-D-alanine-endopeptidase (penicillin-binding protein 4)
MKRSFSTFCAAFFCTVLLQLVQPAHGQAQSEISPQIEQLITQNKADNAFWALTVRDSSGTILESYNPAKLIRPASNLKLLTAATALDKLGADFTYKTYMYGNGSQEGEVWNGDIVIRGSGDPSMSGKFYNDDRLHVMQQFFDMLGTRGIRKINGNLVGNVAYFDEKLYPDGWSWDDLSFYYAVPVSALSFNNNTVDLTVRANGEVGDTPSIEWFPFDTDYVEFVNDQRISPGNAEYDEFYQRLLGTNTILLRSSLPRGYVEKEALSISNPPLFFLDTFEEYLQDGGIQLSGNLIIDNNDHYWEGGSYTELGVHESVPLPNLLAQLNKESDNFYAEMLLKTSAAEYYNTKGTTELGISLVKSYLSSFGIDYRDVEMSDGSGMSSTNLISTRDLSLLLAKVQGGSAFQTFKNSLPVAGVDGSLQYRFRKSSLKNRMSAKTGYISGVRSISGYLKAKSDKTVIFSIVTNNYSTRTSYIDSIHRSILENLYEEY